MTPQEQFEYKQQWLATHPHAVTLHSDLDVKGKDWCRHHLDRKQWSMTPYTDVYEHTFLFESDTIAHQFAGDFPEYAKYVG